MILARLARGPGEHDSAHALLGQRIDGGGHGEMRLARARRADSDDDVVVLNVAEVLALPRRLRLDDPADTRQRDSRPAKRAAVSITCVGAVVPEMVGGVAEPENVVGGQLAALPGRLKHLL